MKRELDSTFSENLRFREIYDLKKDEWLEKVGDRCSQQTRLSSIQVAKRHETPSSRQLKTKLFCALSSVPETHLAVTHKEDHGGVRRPRGVDQAPAVTYA